MMRAYRIIVVICFVIVAILFSAIYVKEYTETDNTRPKITLMQDELYASVKDGKEKLLEGVTAFDGKDGDITNKVIVESVSKFIEKGVCKVTYAVCDSDNHVTTATRKVVYTDYQSPRFSVNKSMCYSIYERVDLRSTIGVTDHFDGSLTNAMVLTSPNYAASTEGVFSVDATVTNSKGDMTSIRLPLIVENRSLTAPKIELKEYLVYVEKGQEFAPRRNILGVVSDDVTLTSGSVKVDTNLNVNQEGTYTVHYYATDINGERGHSIMTVIVGNGGQ